MNLANCFLSGKPVLEFEGQFSVFENYLLDSNEDRERVVREGVSGWCYNLYLVKSAWGPFWAEHLFRNLVQVRGYRILQEKRDLILIRNDRTGKVLVLSHDGPLFKARSYGSVKRDLPERRANGFFIPVEHDFNLTFGEFPELVGEVQEALDKHKEYPLVDLVSYLGLMDNMIFPEALQGGKLKYEEEYRMYWGPGSISAKASYFSYLPDDVGQLLFPDLREAT